MSGARGLIPAAVAIGVGVFTGYYTFKPAFQELDAERRFKDQSQSPVAHVNPNTTVQNSTLPSTSQSDNADEGRKAQLESTK